MKVQIDEDYAGELAEKAEVLAARIRRVGLPQARRLRDPALGELHRRAWEAYLRILVDQRRRIEEVVARRAL